MAMVRAKSNLENLTISYGKFKSKTNANLEYLISKMWQGQDKAKNNLEHIRECIPCSPCKNSRFHFVKQKQSYFFNINCFF